MFSGCGCGFTWPRKKLKALDEELEPRMAQAVEEYLPVVGTAKAVRFFKPNMVYLGRSMTPSPEPATTGDGVSDEVESKNNG